MTSTRGESARWRQRIDRLLRRAEREPERTFELLGERVGPLVRELERARSADRSGRLEAVVHLLERVSRACAECTDRLDRIEAAIGEAVALLNALLDEERTEEDPGRSGQGGWWERLLRIWLEDRSGLLFELEEVLSRTREDPLLAPTLVELLRRDLARLPLVFPVPGEERPDLHRAILAAERHRRERLLGDFLAARGEHDFAIAVATDHYRRNRDALDLVEALRRAGRIPEALGVVRHALRDPRAYRRQRLQTILEELLRDDPEPASDRETRRCLEEEFSSFPSAVTFAALKAVVPIEQWPAVRDRVLGHLEKHQKAPTLLFELLLDEGQEAEADALATKRPVDPDALVSGAQRLSVREPEKAAGWFVLAAFSRAVRGGARSDARAVRDLAAARDLAHLHGQAPSFERALQRFRRRFRARRRLQELLEAQGLGALPLSDV